MQSTSQLDPPEHDIEHPETPGPPVAHLPQPGWDCAERRLENGDAVVEHVVDDRVAKSVSADLWIVSPPSRAMPFTW